MCFDVFLFSAGDESGWFNELDGAREVCGHVFSREIKEDLPNIRHDISEVVGSWCGDRETPFLVE